MSAPQELQGRSIVLGLTGGIACYKAAELTRELVRAGARVQVVMTEAATRFIGEATMQALSNHPVYRDTWDPRPANSMAHIELSRAADAVLVAPASAFIEAEPGEFSFSIFECFLCSLSRLFTPFDCAVHW